MENNSENLYRSLSSQMESFTKDKIKTLCNPKLKTGFSELDKMLGGGISSGTTVLGAMSGLGKSTFLLQLAQNISKNRIPVLYFSLEMTNILISAKAISRQIFIDSKFDEENGIMANTLMNQEKSEQFDEDVWKRIDKSRSRTIKECKNLYIIERKNERISALKISEIVNKFIDKERKKPVVIVDYLQILSPENNNFRGSDKQIADENIRQLTTLAIGNDIPVILISSLNRESYNKPIQLESLKESGSIEYSADVVLGLQFCKVKEKSFKLDEEKSRFPRNVELVALKQRYGISGASASVKFSYYAKFDFFQEKINKLSSFSDKTTKRI